MAEHVEVNGKILLDIYLDGFGSGVASCLRSLLGEEDTAGQDEFIAGMTRALVSNPKAMDEIARRCHARVIGSDQGPSTLQYLHDPGNLN